MRNTLINTHSETCSNLHDFLRLCSFSLQRYEESIAPFRLCEEQAGGDVQELKRLSPWKVSDKDLEAIKPKVCVFGSMRVFEHKYDVSVK